MQTARPEAEISRRIVELRRYGIAEGRIADMVERFESLTAPILASFGGDHLGAWVDEKSGDFLFMVAFPDRNERQAAWDAYHVHPGYLAAKQEQAAVISSISVSLLAPLDRRAV